MATSKLAGWFGLDDLPLDRGQITAAFCARRTERGLIRKLTKAGGFLTAIGRMNKLVGVSPQGIDLKTEAGGDAIHIRRTKLRAAMRHFYARRTVTRVELEPYSAYSSAMFGLLRVIFERIAKIVKSPTGLLRLTLNGIRYYFAGVDRAPRDMEVAATNGADYVLMSYFYLRDDPNWRYHVTRLRLKVLLDSGAFTVYEARKKNKSVTPIHVEDYAEFIRDNRDVLHAWFNLDVIGDAEASEANAGYLRAEDLAPIEVWHGGGDIEVLAEMVARNPAVIAIGGTAKMPEDQRREVFDRVFERFPKQNFHGLGLSSTLMFDYPWFSVDSTAWLVGRKYCKLIDGGVQYQGHAEADPLECLAFNVQALCGHEEFLDEQLQPARRHDALGLAFWREQLTRAAEVLRRKKKPQPAEEVQMGFAF